MALTELEDDTGTEGHPLSLEYDDDMDGWFEARPVVNHAAAARERYLQQHPTLEPGTRLIVVDTRPPDQR